MIPIIPQAYMNAIIEAFAAMVAKEENSRN
jgi:hypothetical protein